MSALDWAVVVITLAGVVLYGVWRSRGERGLDDYLVAGRSLAWPMVAFSVMSTQASAITFLSTPGQAYADGMRFLQFYFGLPIAMVVLAATAVPIFHRLRVFTAYEYLETRFDAKTRALAALLFLIQRGLAAGLTIYAPSLILSVVLGWSIQWTILAIGALVMAYTVFGGSKAVSHTHSLQFAVIWSGLAIVAVVIASRLPHGISALDALAVAGRLGRLNIVDPTFDLENRYNLWSGLIGGCFLAMSYFGTDQSQVGRYLTGRSVTQSRLGLLFNGLAKVPMQFVVLGVGALVFAFYLFTPPPVFFNPEPLRAVERSELAPEFERAAGIQRAAATERADRARALVEARRLRDPAAVAQAGAALEQAHRDVEAARGATIDVLQKADPGLNPNDVNYVFLRFVLQNLPVGIIGLVLAMVFSASMSASSAEMSALSSTTIVDVWKRWLGGGGKPMHELHASRWITLMWGVFAIGFAEFAGRLGSLVEAVNVLGSLFYGTILGIFLTAFYLKRVGGTPVFIAAIVAEAVVLACFRWSKISFLWFNVVGCLVVIGLAAILALLVPRWRQVARTA
ncbi:MAG TPA: sodium:solute symporter [Candidatus Eisenbacteria bacterium]|nr:sodium:solute symporter [Candidatus Eisenbacteria bacterium]